MSKQKWVEGKQHEIDFWSKWFETKGSEWKKDYADRLDANLPFQEYLVKYLPKSPPCSILDVGAGPLTLLGKVLPGYELGIIAVDPLAGEYDHILTHLPVVNSPQMQIRQGFRSDLRFLM